MIHWFTPKSPSNSPPIWGPKIFGAMFFLFALNNPQVQGGGFQRQLPGVKHHESHLLHLEGKPQTSGDPTLKVIFQWILVAIWKNHMQRAQIYRNKLPPHCFFWFRVSLFWGWVLFLVWESCVFFWIGYLDSCWMELQKKSTLLIPLFLQKMVTTQQKNKQKRWQPRVS